MGKNREEVSLNLGDKINFYLMKGTKKAEKGIRRFLEKNTGLYVYNDKTGEKVYLDLRLGEEFLEEYRADIREEGIRNFTARSFGNYFVSPGLFEILKEATGLEAKNKAWFLLLKDRLNKEEKERFIKAHSVYVSTGPLVAIYHRGNDCIASRALSNERDLLEAFAAKYGYTPETETTKSVMLEVEKIIDLPVGGDLPKTRRLIPW